MAVSLHHSEVQVFFPTTKEPTANLGDKHVELFSDDTFLEPLWMLSRHLLQLLQLTSTSGIDLGESRHLGTVTSLLFIALY